MSDEPSIRRYRNTYTRLLYFYPKPYYERFGEGIAQTFNDLLNERLATKQAVFHFTLWMFLETSIGIIQEHLTSLLMQHMTKRLSVWAMVVALMLSVPLIAMQFTHEVTWTLFDFVLMGTLLLGASLVYELITRKMNTPAYRAAVGIAGVTSVLLVWVNGAVGIIGDGPINLIYFGVLLIGLIDALLVRFRAPGMSQTLFVMAFAQFFVPIIALLVQTTDFSPGVAQVFGLNTFFVVAWIGSALLFRGASRTTST